MNIIISVPFVRNIRHSLSIPFTSELKKYGKLIIVCPFKLSEADLDFLKLHDVEFISLDYEFNGFHKFLFNISDYLRRAGYFGNKKIYGMPYLFKNLFLKRNPSGNLERLSNLIQYNIIISSIVFRNKNIWRLFETFIFKLARHNTGKINKLASLQNVIYFQSANWGLQDRLLCNFAIKKKWKSVLIPYTTDQVHATGHMLKEHNVYAVQSELEKQYAISLHNIKEEKIQIIGSIWYRQIDNILKKRSKFIDINPKATAKRILYSGMSDIFFPRFTEINCVKNIAEVFTDCEIKYCPYVEGDRFNSLVEKFKHLKNVEILPFQSGMTEFASTGRNTIEKDMYNHIEKLKDIDVFVMSHETSMSTEANYVSDCPIIANFIDDFGILEKRNIKEYPKWWQGKELISVYTQKELTNAIKLSLNNKPNTQSKKPYLYWDNEINLKHAIKKVMDKL